MKIEVNKDVMVGALTKVGGIVERRQTLPILSNLMVLVREGEIELIGTDLEIEVRTTINAVTQGEGALTLPARKILDICRALPDGSQIVVDVEPERAIVRSGRGRFTLSTLPARDYPIGEVYGADYQLALNSQELLNLIVKTAFAMALQDVRHYLNGLLLEVKAGYLNAVATDGHRLAKASRRIGAFPDKDLQIILPRKTVMELLRHLGVKEDLLRVDLGTKFARLSYGNTMITTKLIDARFPDYERVIPRGEGRPVIVQREELRHALARTAILSNEKYKGVLLDFEPDLLRLRAQNPEQEEAVEEQSIHYHGDAISIGFNVEYLKAILEVIDISEIEMRIMDDNNSLRIIESGEQTNTYVVMPMRL